MTGRRWSWALQGLLVIALPAAMILSLGVGVYPVPLRAVAAILLSRSALPLSHAGGWTGVEVTVVEIVRLPRIALATLSGVGLGLSGAALQGVFRNPLVGPDIVGASAGAACGGVLAILIGWNGGALVGCAFAGGFAAIVLAALIANAGSGGGLLRIVLAGVLVGAFGSALIGLIEYMANPETTLPAIVFWLMGSFADADRAKVLTLAAALIAGGAVLVALRWRMNLLSLGDADARALGVAVGRLRWAVLAAVALIVAAQVAVSGIVGWIGLITPHAARALVGPDHRRLLPASGLLGGLFTLAIDDLARSVAAQELPVGLLSALIGTPVFALLFLTIRRTGWSGG